MNQKCIESALSRIEWWVACPHLDYEHIEYMKFRKHVQKGYKSPMITMGNMKWCNMKTRPSHHHHHIHERAERAKNGSEWWIFCVYWVFWWILWKVWVLGDTGLPYYGTLYFQSHFPRKLGWQWSTDKTGYETFFCVELYSDVLEKVIEPPL